MNDEVEEQLRRQPLRMPPAEWRAEILGAARAQRLAVPKRKARPWWREWLWPSPFAWAGAAALWMAALAFHLSTPGMPSLVVGPESKPHGSVTMAFTEQRAWLEQILQPPSRPTAPGRSVTRPRTEHLLPTKTV